MEGTVAVMVAGVLVMVLEGTGVVMVATGGGDEGRAGACTGDAGITVTRLNLLLIPLNRRSHRIWFQNWSENNNAEREWSSPSLTHFTFQVAEM